MSDVDVKYNHRDEDYENQSEELFTPRETGVKGNPSSDCFPHLQMNCLLRESTTETRANIYLYKAHQRELKNTVRTRFDYLLNITSPTAISIVIVTILTAIITAIITVL